MRNDEDTMRQRDNFFIVKCLEQVVEVKYSTEQTSTNKLEQTRT